jgi:hypothetical protein
VTNSVAPWILRLVSSGPTHISDAAIVSAASALARGEPIAALGFVGREESALGLTLRGIAYAQLGDYALSQQSLERAEAESDEPRTRAQARAALVEVALSTGDPAPAARAARESAQELERLGDARNASMQWLVLARAEVLLGRLGEARHLVDTVLEATLAPDVRAVAFVARAEIAVRELKATSARAALESARREQQEARHHLLARAISALDEGLSRPIARIEQRKSTRSADLFAIEEIASGEVLLVDACRCLAISGRATIPLARRRVLFKLLLSLARSAPDGVSRDELARLAFDVQRVNASHRSRLRVEMGRLRKAIEDLGAEPVATQDGYALVSKREVAVLLPPSDDEAAHIALLLGDGAAWSAQGLAEHAGVSRSTAQRALNALVESGGAVRTGTGKSVRYTRPDTPIASRMLLLGLVPKA